MVSFEDILYLTEQDLNYIDISDIPRILGEHFDSNNWETYLVYYNLRKNNMTEEEKKYYLNIIKELREKENKQMLYNIEKLKNCSNVVNNESNNRTETN